MKVTLPRSANHPLVRLTVSSPAEKVTMTFDDSHREVELPTFVGYSEGEIGAIAELCKSDGRVDQSAGIFILKEAVLKRKPQSPIVPKTPVVPPPPAPPAPKVEEKPAEPKAEEKPAEPKAEEKPADQKPAVVTEPAKTDEVPTPAK